jgi:hypothetical protein
MSMARGGFMETSNSGYGARAAVSIAAAPDAQWPACPACRQAGGRQAQDERLAANFK